MAAGTGVAVVEMEVVVMAAFVKAVWVAASFPYPLASIIIWPAFRALSMPCKLSGSL